MGWLDDAVNSVENAVHDAANNVVNTTQQVIQSTSNAVQSAGQSIAQGAQNLGHNILNLAQGAIDNAGFLPLAPYVPIMKLSLRKKGKPEGGNLKETSLLFYNIVVKGNDFYIYSYHYANAKGENSSGSGVSVDQVLAIIKEVLPFLTALISKFKNGSEAEKKAVNDTNKLVNQVVQSSGNATPSSVENTPAPKTDTKGLFSSFLPLVAIGLVGYVLFAKK
jgi:hypothetical protein